MEKLLIECTLELFAAGIVTGIQDLGGAGLSCATSELASAGDGGMHVDLDKVPLRDASLAPEEILMSESQERMMAVVEPGDVEQFLKICAKWDVQADVIGEVTDTGRLQIDWHGERVVDVPPRTVAHEGPVYQRPFARPVKQAALMDDPAESLTRPKTADDLRDTLLTTGRLAEPVRPVLGHRPVRPLRARQLGPGAARGQRHDPGRRAVRPRRRGVDRLQRAVRGPRPVRRRAARAGRVVPQRGHDRRPADRRHRLPELRLAGGRGRDVAVRPGRPRAWPTGARRSASRSPAATCRSTTRPARRRSCRPRWSVCSA